MKGAFPPQRPALYAKVSYCFKNRVKRKSQTNLQSKNEKYEVKKSLNTNFGEKDYL